MSRAKKDRLSVDEDNLSASLSLMSTGSGNEAPVSAVTTEQQQRRRTTTQLSQPKENTVQGNVTQMETRSKHYTISAETN